MTKKRLHIIAAVAFILALSGSTLAKEITITGKLKRTVEPGGWVVATAKGEYLILNYAKFQNESWFRENSLVEAVGEPKPDVVTTQMQGVPFEARTMRPLNQNDQGDSTPESRQLTRVTVGGDSIVQAQPDTAVLTIAVVTQAKLAIDAQQQNAARTEAVIKALKAAAGAGAEIKTSGYSLQPQRIYKENQPPTITGYEARNSVTVTLSDLTKVGTLIDATTVAGANDVTGISFILRKDRPARDQALTEATREAVSKAQVIAQALGGKVVRILAVQEEGTVRPQPIYEADYQTLKARVATTPIEIGTLEISSRIQLVAEVEVAG